MQRKSAAITLVEAGSDVVAFKRSGVVTSIEGRSVVHLNYVNHPLSKCFTRQQRLFSFKAAKVLKHRISRKINC